MDSITRIKEYIKKNFSSWIKVDYSEFDEKIDFRKDWSELYKINDEEIILISYTNISITGTDRPKPQLRVFLDEYKKPFYFAKKHQFRYYLFSIFTKEDEMARGLNNFNPKEYIISIETNLDKEGSRRDLRSIYDYVYVQYIAKSLYPDLFQDIDPVKNLEEFYGEYLPVKPNGTFMTQYQVK